jgi:hypothetical protein
MSILTSYPNPLVELISTIEAIRILWLRRGLSNSPSTFPGTDTLEFDELP